MLSGSFVKLSAMSAAVRSFWEAAIRTTAAFRNLPEGLFLLVGLCGP